MNRITKRLLAILIGAMCLANLAWANMPATTINLPANQTTSIDDPDDEPEVTDRVARISYIDGGGKVRRNGSDDWETLTLNLPLVEGDEISTDDRSRIEIQFDKNQHLRLDSNSYLKLVTLKDEGIALSLSLGSAIVKITAFDKSVSYFEIDAPRTTIAVQKAGRFRIDAGKEGDDSVQAGVSDGGEARIYSDNAGFTLKDGRSTRIFVSGSNAGDWENADASRADDDFQQWALDRESVVAKRLDTAFYDRYYDDDIYGADDLNDNGEWVNTADYGYVWSPSRLALAQYADWSPYRYGHWRWMQPFGWVWVNDEPWGWATYHHGRWLYYSGRWVWSPYSYYRTSRSWWSPAFVVINIFNNNVCWYPLGYHHRRYNYNWNHQTPRNTKVSTRTPRPPLSNGPTKISTRVPSGKDPEVPTTGVVTVETKDFGSRNARAKSATPVIARTILTKDPGTGTATNLPTYKERRRSIDIVTERPKLDPVVMQTRVGAAPRKNDAPMDEELRTKRIFGGRPPQTKADLDTVRQPSEEPRKTGAVERPPIVTKSDPVRIPRETESEKPRRTPPVRETPIYTPPEVKETPRYTPPPRETPRSTDTPKQSERPTRVETPVKPAPKSDPPPSKSDSKPAERPAAPARKDKPDNR
ncbi:MAG: FecR domain-containing protein [Pyrinomonadaceae bacterium]